MGIIIVSLPGKKQRCGTCTFVATSNTSGATVRTTCGSTATTRRCVSLKSTPCMSPSSAACPSLSLLCVSLVLCIPLRSWVLSRPLSHSPRSPLPRTLRTKKTTASSPSSRRTSTVTIPASCPTSSSSSSLSSTRSSLITPLSTTTMSSPLRKSRIRSRVWPVTSLLLMCRISSTTRAMEITILTRRSAIPIALVPTIPRATLSPATKSCPSSEQLRKTQHTHLRHLPKQQQHLCPIEASTTRRRFVFKQTFS